MTAAAAPPRSGWGGPLSIRGHLLLLLTTLLLPVLAFAGLVIWRFAESERARIETHASDVVREATAILDRSFADIFATARVLAESEALAEGDLAAFHQRAVATARILGGVVTLRDGASRQVVNSNIRWGDPLPRSTSLAAADAAVARTGRPVVSDLFRGVADPALQFAVVLPVRVGGRGDAPYFLSVSVPVTRIQRILDEFITLGPGAIAGVVDRRGVFVARTKDPQLVVGKAVRYIGSGLPRPGGQAIGPDQDGVPSLLAYHWSSVSGWRTGVVVPLSLLRAPLHRALWLLGGIGAGAVALALLGAFAVAERITRSARALSAAAAALGRDEPVPALATPLREANAVGAVLADAARELHVREAGRARAAAALHLADQRFRVALLSAPVTASTCDRELRYTWIANPHRGLTANAVPGRRDDEIATTARPEEVAALVALKREVLETGAGVRRDLTWTGRDGRVSHYDVIAEPLRDGGGGAAVIGVTVAALDVTSHVAAVQALRLQEERQHLLLNELNHRVKNSLAAVQAIVAQTLRAAPDLESAQARLQARLLALSAAHDVLTRENWEGAPLAELFDAALAPLRPAEPGRVQREGPTVWLPPRATLALTLAFHELATNAAKYGALSVPSGRVAVTWSLGAGRVLRLRWAESGGPRVAPPTRRGFGSRLIERSLAHDLRGRVAMEFRPEGLVCTIEATLPERDAPPAAWPAAVGEGEGGPMAGPRTG